jgi:hypothetical protein
MLASTSSQSPPPNTDKSPSRQSTLRSPTRTPQDPDDATWGSNFWVTLVDPQVTSVSSWISLSNATQSPKLPFSPALLLAK